MKIIHYIPSLDRTSGGTGSYMQLLAKELGQLVELHIVSHESANPLVIENSQVHYISSSLFKGMKKEWLDLLQAIRPDVVHVNCCWMPGCAFIQKWAQQVGYKVILTPHGMLEPWIIKRHYWTRKIPALLLYQKNAVQKADYLHATAESEKENLLQLGYNNKVAVIANGVAVEEIQLKKSWERKKQILFLSRVHIKKGINFLIETVAALKEELQGYRIHIAGEGEEAYINELKSLANQMGIANLIHFTGGVYGKQKWELFRNADVFILPTHSENFGIVVAEALASGVPVITTKGTPWNELEKYNCGWWTNVGTKATIDALRNFLALSENELQQMGRNGRNLIEERYSTRMIAKQMKELYSKTITRTF